MNDTSKPYRTLIQGRLCQLSALSVGGSAGLSDHPDACYRDGRNRLTVPATSLAGALIETAARVFPTLLDKDDSQRLLRDRVTAKKDRPPQDDDHEFLQSVWRLRHAHPVDASTATEWRQGVGIRQATGATAREKGALYDFEVVPRGTQWTFFLEIDTARHAGGAEDGRCVEALAALALNEWVAGRAWIGRSPARGTGWLQLQIDRVLRLKTTEEAIDAWPDNTDDLPGVLDKLAMQSDVLTTWETLLTDSRRVAKEQHWTYGKWQYLTLAVTLRPGLADSGYGLDVLQVGGHPAGELDSNSLPTAKPLSVDPDSTDSRGDFQQPDAPFVNTRPAGKDVSEPFLPGSGLRGPLRHMASRLVRPATDVRDPNWRKDPEKERVDKILDAKRAQQKPRSLLDRDVRPVVDQVTSLFGAEELCGRLLVRDAELTDGGFTLFQTEHHAEDEFTAGVYGTSKFDRHVLAAGTLAFELLLEAEDSAELKAMASQLVPALEMARLGHLPVGGGKWRGAGWVPWRVEKLHWSRAGSRQVREQPVVGGQTIAAALEQLWQHKEPACD